MTAAAADAYRFCDGQELYTPPRAEEHRYGRGEDTAANDLDRVAKDTVELELDAEASEGQDRAIRRADRRATDMMPFLRPLQWQVIEKM